MDNQIDWSLFSRYWSPPVNETHRVHLANWRQRIDTFKGNAKAVLVFDVYGVDNETFSVPKEFKVGGTNAINFRPIIDELDKRGEKNLYIEITRDSKNSYSFKVLTYVYDKLGVRL